MAIMRLKNNSIRQGFTLLEAVIVLMITSGTLLIGYTSFTSARSSNTEKVFFKRFDMNWKDMMRLTAYDGYQSTITFHKEARKVSFFYQKGRHRKTKYVDMPDDLEPATDRTIKVNKGGFVKPITVALKSKGIIKYKLTVQMGWGVYEITQ